MGGNRWKLRENSWKLRENSWKLRENSRKWVKMIKNGGFMTNFVLFVVYVVMLGVFL